MRVNFYQIQQMAQNLSNTNEESLVIFNGQLNILLAFDEAKEIAV